MNHSKLGLLILLCPWRRLERIDQHPRPKPRKDRTYLTPTSVPLSVLSIVPARQSETNFAYRLTVSLSTEAARRRTRGSAEERRHGPGGDAMSDRKAACEGGKR